MKKYIARCARLMVLLLILLVAGCRSSGQGTTVDSEKMRALGDSLVADLREKIMPEREKPDNLLQYGYVLNENDITYNAALVSEFYDTYENGGDCELTVVFSGSSFVVVRVVFSDGAGYYMRYEYDVFNPDEYSVSAQPVDRLEIAEQESPPKLTLTISKGGKQVAEFSLKNPDYAG